MTRSENSLLCVPTLPMFAYSSGAFGNDCQPFSRLLCKIEITEFTVMGLFCFVRAAEFGVPNLFFLNRLCALRDEGCLCANKRVVILLKRKMNAKIMKRVQLMTINDSKVDAASALIVLASASKVH